MRPTTEYPSDVNELSSLQVVLVPFTTLRPRTGKLALVAPSHGQRSRRLFKDYPSIPTQPSYRTNRLRYSVAGSPAYSKCPTCTSVDSLGPCRLNVTIASLPVEDASTYPTT